MKTITKKIHLAILAFVVSVLCALGIVFSKPIQTSAETVASTFAMDVGASVRIATDSNGIRFSATVGSDTYNEVFDSEGNSTEGKALGMFVVPKFYFDDYTAYCLENPTYVAENEVKYFDYFANVKEKMHNATYNANQLIKNADGSYTMRLALIDVLFNNINTQFCAVAYVATTEGETTTYRYADFNFTDNARSMAYVAAIAEEYGEAGMNTYIEQSVCKSAGVTYNADTQKYVFDQVEYDTMTDALTASGKTMDEAKAAYAGEYIYGENNPAFDVEVLGKTVKASEFVSSKTYNAIPIKMTKDAPYVDVENGNKTGIYCLTYNIDTAIYYDHLLPTEDPEYDYYEWRIYTDKDIKWAVCGGKGAVELQQGWNTVNFTWAELSTNGNFWSDAAGLKGATLAFGNLTGKDFVSDVKVLGTVVDASSFVGSGTSISLTMDAKYVDSENGNTTALLVQRTGNDLSFHWANALPATDPGYDYYEWRIYAESTVTLGHFGGCGAITLQQGWNTVKIDSWVGLTSSNASSYTQWGPTLAFGNLTGCYNA